MLIKITLSEIDYWYDPEWRQLYTDQEGTKYIQAKWLSEHDQRTFMREKGEIDAKYKQSKG